MKEEKIKVLALLPMELPKEIELDNTLEAMVAYILCHLSWRSQKGLCSLHRQYRLVSKPILAHSVAVYLPKKPRERMEVLGIEYDECPDY